MDYNQLLSLKSQIKLKLGIESNQTNRSSNNQSNADGGNQLGQNTNMQQLIGKDTRQTHWDNLLQEMNWLANDFQLERQRHIASAKKIVRAVELYHKNKEVKKAKKGKDEIINLRRVSSKISRDVRNFWLKINKVVAFKQKAESDEIRQKAMDKHLMFLVKQTERYTMMLADNMREGIEFVDEDSISQQNNSPKRLSKSASNESGRSYNNSPKRLEHQTWNNRVDDSNSISMIDVDTTNSKLTDNDLIVDQNDDSDNSSDDEDYIHMIEEPDDETTLIEQEAVEKDDVDKVTELDLLKNESEIPIEQLRELYKNLHSAADINEEDSANIAMDNINDSDNDDDYEDTMEDLDDETTLIEQEKLELDLFNKNKNEVMSVSDECKLLLDESEMSLEELKQKYGLLDSQYLQEDFDDNSDDTEDDENYNIDLESNYNSQSPEVTSSTKLLTKSDRVKNKKVRIVLPNSNDSLDINSNNNSSNSDNDVYVSEDTEEDDETTLIEQEKLEKDDYENEMELLKNENDEEEDDETTLIEQEKLEKNEYENEMELLKNESEIPIEQLLAMYKNGRNEDGEQDSDNSNNSDSNSNSDMDNVVDRVDNEDEYKSYHSDDDSSDMYVDEDDEEEDDETTLIEQEKLEKYEYENEMELLKNESEIPIEQLLAMYKNGNVEKDESEDDENDSEIFHSNGFTDRDDEIAVDTVSHYNNKNSFVDKKENEDDNDFSDNGSENMNISDSDNDEDFHLSDTHDDEDDETTMIAQELLEKTDPSTSYDDELIFLKQESELSIEKLRAKYANMVAEYSDQEENNVVDDDNYSEDSNANDLMASNKSDIQLNTSTNEMNQMEVNSVHSEVYCKHVNHFLTVTHLDTEDDNVDDAFKRLEAADLAARSVMVERPFVLSKAMQLREYQQQGLNWLVSLCERRLNGILADEMGLGKTIQTIALLAHLAVHRGIWGPHLIIVPTSCIINWEVEFKKWCPIFKVLTYFGSSKVRKFLRNGWNKLNSFHICITSYQLVVQDSSSFRRKRWYYMILDEAHNIKNFKSKRWQTLLNFNTQRRLLLTGTPLQNNLMELWSLMHFLMPHIFRSRKEFSYWFSNPLSGMVEGTRGINNDIIGRLHGIMRPFLLRRLKKDVAKQLPGKYEHIINCRLSKRQMYLYEEYMARSTTKSSLSGGNYLGMMNILMQLRKVCNHPDLFETRPISSPFVGSPLLYNTSKLFFTPLQYQPLTTLSPNLMRFWHYDMDDIAKSDYSQLLVSQEQFYGMIIIDDLSLPQSHTNNNNINNDLNNYYDKLVSCLQSNQLNQQAFNYRVYTHNNLQLHESIRFNWRTVSFIHSSTFPISSFSNNMNRFSIREYLLFLQVSNYNQIYGSLGLYYNRIRKYVNEIWFEELILSIPQRINLLHNMIEQFVFILPKVIAFPVQVNGILSQYNSSLGIGNGFIANNNNNNNNNPYNIICKLNNLYYPIKIRQSITFPDRKLIQYDSGKLQVLANLLHDLKRNGHKCLIFTQMSKMLDILEIFLNLHNYTFVRLDGSTDINKRQKLMDRFNNDSKLFCFILSTRSGGLGINLTGADTVIFYDTDWNPAMDAQAQDRAHRIGQTRDVHIYRLVCQNTIEENILMKAKQKKHLDFLVMTEGNFSEASLFSAKGLKDVFGLEKNNDNVELIQENHTSLNHNNSNNNNNNNVIDFEAAMLAVEDEEDISAMKTMKAEINNDLDEFNENNDKFINNNNNDTNENENNDDGDGDDDGNGNDDITNKNNSLNNTMISNDEVNEEKDIEKEFASWQASVGYDFNALQAALKPIERYALHVRLDVDPYYSMFYLNEQTRLELILANHENDSWNIEEIERLKEEEEFKILNDGELIATNVLPRDIKALKQTYLAEKSHRSYLIRVRRLTGQAWSINYDNGVPYWYNDDTGEACYETPQIILDNENYQLINERRYNAMPINIMIHIFSFLIPYPDRIYCSLVCAKWALAAKHSSFIKKVLPIESGARDYISKQNKDNNSNNYNNNNNNNSNNTFVSIEEAIRYALPGDLIELGAGHHWESCLTIPFPLRIISTVPDDSSKCVIELTGQLKIENDVKALVLIGITLRRPGKQQIASSSILMNSKSKLMMYDCIVDNDGAHQTAIVMDQDCMLFLHGTIVRRGYDGIYAKKST
eukprot:gene11354-15225_t